MKVMESKWGTYSERDLATVIEEALDSSLSGGEIEQLRDTVYNLKSALAALGAELVESDSLSLQTCANVFGVYSAVKHTGGE